MKEKIKIQNLFIFMYFFMICIVSYTAMNSPYIANHYWQYIWGTNLFILAVTYYMYDFKMLKVWWKKNWNAAKKRNEMRKALEKKLKEQGY